jgi:hypothetical protein
MIVVHHLDDSRSQQILWLLGDPKTRCFARAERDPSSGKVAGDRGRRPGGRRIRRNHRLPSAPLWRRALAAVAIDRRVRNQSI